VASGCVLCSGTALCVNAPCDIPIQMSDLRAGLMFSQTVVTFSDTNFHKTSFLRFRVVTFIQTDELRAI